MSQIKLINQAEMKRIGLLTAVAIIINLTACDKMDDNYRQYLEMNRVYSPRVTNLTAEVGLKQATLKWDNPPGDLAQKIMVDYQDSLLLFETMVDSVSLDSLEIKGYTISVFTLDKFNNKSIPSSIQVFPNGEKQ
jgi:hypothetical protein